MDHGPCVTPYKLVINLIVFDTDDSDDPIKYRMLVKQPF